MATTLPKLDFDLELVEASSEAQVHALFDLMLYNDTWKHLARVEAPKRGKFYLNFHNKVYHGHLIRRDDTKECVGFSLLDTRKMNNRYRREAEIDIAITNTAYRGQGLSKLALGYTLDAWLLTDRVDACWGWVDKRNLASLGMVGALEIPVVKEAEGEGIVHDGRADIVEIKFDQETWAETRARLGFRPAKLDPVPDADWVPTPPSDA